MISSPLKGTDWKNKISQHYGENKAFYTEKLGKYGIFFHNGTDFATPMGTSIHASFDCEIIFAGEDKTGFGNCIFIRSPQRHNGEYLDAVYAHLSRIDVKTGDKINMGDKLGETGSTGMSSGPHLHWSVRKKDKNLVTKNKDNGGAGYLDIEKYIMWWE